MVNYDSEEEVQEVEVAAEVEEETEVEETTEETEPEEEVIDWEARAKKAEAKFILAKAKPRPVVVVEKEVGTLSTKEMYALMEAKVPADDIGDVEEFAKFKGISVTDALKSPTLKTILAQKGEERRMAAGTNTGTTRRGTSKVPDDQLMSKASKGEMPDSVEDIARFNQLRWKIKK